MQKFNKEYTDEEFIQRFYIFKSNSDFIRYENTLGRDWTLGINQYTDLTREEFKQLYLMDDFVVPTERKYPAELIKNVKVPPAIDWRTQGAVTEVKNQGTCKGGYAFSTTGAIEGIWKIAGNNLVSLSEQQLISCSSAYGNRACSQGYPDYCYEYISALGGITSETIYPFTAGNNVVNSCIPTLASQRIARINGYYNVNANDPAQLIAAIVQQPISVGVEADQYVWQYYSGGIITSNCGNDINHFALVVAYNITASTPYYVVKNSWGSSWGMNGYVNIAITGHQGVCGIQIIPSYPTF